MQSQTGYKTLIDGFNVGESYIARLDSSFIPKQTRNRNAGTLHIEFSRFPQRYLASGKVEIALTHRDDPYVITNPTPFDAKPLIVVTGSGTFTIEDKTLTVLQGASTFQTIYIDCETMEAWERVDGGIVPRNDYIQNIDDGFPVLKSGANNVTVGSGIMFLKITPRWWRV